MSAQTLAEKEKKMAGIGKTLRFYGNWKAEMTPAKTREFFKKFANEAVVKNFNLLKDSGAKIMIAPPSACLESARLSINEHSLGQFVELGVQAPWHVVGAYTGFTTLEMAKDPAIAAKYAVIGHSERRQPWRTIEAAIRNSLKGAPSPLNPDDVVGSVIASILKEIAIDSNKPQPFGIALDRIVNAQVKEALKVGITPILCVGETLSERKEGRTTEVVLSQLSSGLEGLPPELVKLTEIAYEPVWAIGTGETASPEQAEEVHVKIYDRLSEHAQTPKHNIPIVYGGSMKPDNVAALVKKPPIWGGLIGGASLKADVFMLLIQNGIAAVS